MSPPQSTNPTQFVSRKSNSKGVALVLTLLIISLLVVIVVGFTSVVRLEQTAARNFTFKNTAQQMAQLATGQAMQRLSEALLAGNEAGLYSTQSGILYPRGEDPELLFSQSPTATTNINSATQYGFVSGNPGDSIQVGLLDVRSSDNALIGRTAFYIGDESSKLPVNNATGDRATGNSTSLNPPIPRPFSIRGLDAALPASAIGNFTRIIQGTNVATNTSISNWSFFFTPQQLADAVGGIGSTRSRQATVSTVSSAVAPQTPWRSPKVPINTLPLDDASVSRLVSDLTNPSLASFFGGHFGDKYGAQGVRQLAANMLQMRSSHWTGGGNFTTTETVLGTSGLNGPVTVAPDAGEEKKTNGIPQQYYGYVPFPMIRHLAVSAAYGWTAVNRMSVRISLECEIFNPFPIAYPPGGEIVAQIDKARFLMSYEQWRGPDGTAQEVTPHNDRPSSDPWGRDDTSWWGPSAAVTPLNGTIREGIPGIPANGSTTLQLNFDLSFEESNPAAVINPPIYCIIDNVKLLATSGQANSIRDWCSGNDFFNALAASDAGPAQFQITAINGPTGLPSSPAALPAVATPNQKLVRLDPRMRPALEVSSIRQTEPPGRAWIQIAYAADPPAPANFLNADIPADPAHQNDISQAIASHSQHAAVRLPSGRFSGAGDLGKVFTGMPWRTLRIQPQPAAEMDAELIPDWTLLDIIDFTDGSIPITPVNPNPSFASLANPVVGYGSGFRSQIDVLTGNFLQGGNLTLFDPIDRTPERLQPPASFLTSLRNIGLDSQTMNAVVSRLGQPSRDTSWAAGAGWNTRRSALEFPQDSLMIPSEITEINGIANYITAPDEFKFNEYRLNALFPGLTTQSQFFQIYAIGEATEGTNPPTVVSTYLLQTLVEVDNSTTPPTLRTVLQYPPAN